MMLMLVYNIVRYNYLKDEEFSIYSTHLHRPIFRDPNPNQLRTMHDHLQHQPRRYRQNHHQVPSR